jgi:hypothetical protein
MWCPELTDIKSIILNVIGGALVAFFALMYGWLSRKCRQWAVKKVMGDDFDKDGTYHIVYGSFILPPLHDQSGQIITHPYIKTPLPPPSPRHSAAAGFSIDNPVSSGEMRGTAYLAGLFGKARACAPRINPDNDMVSRVDVSFVSLGSPSSNLKTEDTVGHSANSLVTMTTAGFVHPVSQQPVMPITPNAQYDYGMILRVCPTQHPTRTWIVCAGLGEWGTSGASWFLANKWLDLFWHTLWRRQKQYAAIVKVRRGQDESAEIVWKQ